MKIAIVGTRGIPNEYGGFEQFADVLSQGLAKKGIDVTVYCSANHNYKEKEYTSYDVGFLIAPIFNAAGRLEDAKMAVQYYLEKLN